MALKAEQKSTPSINPYHLISEIVHFFFQFSLDLISRFNIPANQNTPLASNFPSKIDSALTPLFMKTQQQKTKNRVSLKQEEKFRGGAKNFLSNVVVVMVEACNGIFAEDAILKIYFAVMNIFIAPKSPKIAKLTKKLLFFWRYIFNRISFYLFWFYLKRNGWMSFNGWNLFCCCISQINLLNGYWWGWEFQNLQISIKIQTCILQGLGLTKWKSTSPSA